MGSPQSLQTKAQLCYRREDLSERRFGGAQLSEVTRTLDEKVEDLPEDFEHEADVRVQPRDLAPTSPVFQHCGLPGRGSRWHKVSPSDGCSSFTFALALGLCLRWLRSVSPHQISRVRCGHQEVVLEVSQKRPVIFTPLQDVQGRAALCYQLTTGVDGLHGRDEMIRMSCELW